MLPVYQAISYIDTIRKGGRTTPWAVMVDTGNGIKSFVVKFFQREQEDLRHSVVNEVLGNVLAREFDLPCPTAALIELSEEFQLTLNRDQQKFMD